MSLSVIDKYVTKKEKDLLDYAKILEEIITIDNNKMWQKKSVFVTYSKDIIKIYADEFYFENNANRNNPIEYSNDNINHVLRAIIDYFKKNNQSSMLKEWKNEIFLLSVILCTACYIDFACNIVDGNLTDTKNKFKYLLKYLKNTKILHIKENKYWVNDLFNSVKKNINEDSKAFATISSNNHRNEYKIVSKNPLLYSIEFVYNIPGLNDFDQKIKEDVLKSYDAKFTEMSYDILFFRILTDLISNNEMGTYLIKINKSLKKQNILNALDNEQIKPYIKILVPWDEEVNYQEIIKTYRDRNFDIIYEYEGTENINSKIFGSNSEFIVNEDFIKNNLDNKMEFERKSIKFIVKNKEE